MENKKNNVVSLDDHLSGIRSGVDSRATASRALSSIECPDWMSERAKTHWAEIVESFERNHHLVTELDQDVLKMYCTSFANFIQSDEDLQGAKFTQKFKSGAVQVSAEVTVRGQFLKECTSLAKQLGLTPPSRIQMAATKDPNQSVLDF